MESYRLSFGEIKVFHSNMAEVIVDEDVLIDEVMMDEYHDFLRNTLEPPFSLLINKKHAYSYTFEAQKHIGNLKEIKSIAIVIRTPGAEMAVNTLISINENERSRIKVFTAKEEALDWLYSQQRIQTI
ncbi:hypothetical protein [Aestuariivivens sediminis]|uniref:DUF7793 family protein n=1 Tax=Aestuariivivens sediminis TaxID=2913557 RepID=UPI001F56B4CB|nr:hypothetical protein [Aestuariivivens sediminis]